MLQWCLERSLRTRVSTWIAGAILWFLLVPLFAQTNTFTLTSGSATYRVTGILPASRLSTGAWSADFLIGATDHLFQNGWWFRVNDSTREFAVSTQSSFIQPAPNRVIVTFREPEGIQYRFDYVLTGTATSGLLRIRGTITNVSAVQRTVDTFHYHDFDVNGSAGGDTCVSVAPTWHRQTDPSPSPTVAEVIASPNGLIGWQIGAFATVRTLLTDADIDNLNNSGSPFTGDATGAFQWRHVLNPGQGVEISVQKGVNMPPPGGGLVTGFDRFWKQVHIWCFPQFVNVECSPWVPVFGGLLWCRRCVWQARSVDIFAWWAYDNRFFRWLSIRPSICLRPEVRPKAPITLVWFQWRWFVPPPPPEPPWDPNRPPDIPMPPFFDGLEQPRTTIAVLSDLEEMLALPGTNNFPQFIVGMGEGALQANQLLQRMAGDLTQEVDAAEPLGVQMRDALQQASDSFFDIFFDFQDGFPENPGPWVQMAESLQRMAEAAQQLPSPRYQRSVSPQLRMAAESANRMANLLGGGAGGGGGDREARILLTWDQFRQRLGNVGRSSMRHLLGKIELEGSPGDDDGTIVMLHIQATKADGSSETFEFNPPLDHDGTYAIPLESLAVQTDPPYNWDEEGNDVINVEVRAEVEGYQPGTASTEIFRTDEFIDLILANDLTLQPECQLEGDVNGDGVVDDRDLLIVLFNFGGSGAGDLNGDGTVDDADLLLVLFNFGNTC